MTGQAAHLSVRRVVSDPARALGPLARPCLRCGGGRWRFACNSDRRLSSIRHHGLRVCIVRAPPRACALAPVTTPLHGRRNALRHRRACHDWMYSSALPLTKECSSVSLL